MNLLLLLSVTLFHFRSFYVAFLPPHKNLLCVLFDFLCVFSLFLLYFVYFAVFFLKLWCI